MEPSTILEYFEKRLDLITNSILEIVELESPSHDAGRNRAVSSWVANEAGKIAADLEVEKIAAHGLGDHLIIRAFPSAEKGVLLLGHTDTVHPVDTKLLNKTRIEDGRLYGCGVFDMKANVVLMLEALRYYTETGTRPARPITILLSCDEEVGSFTGREHVEREALRSEFCLVCEPSSNGRVKTGRKGTGMFTVKAHGVPAHAGLEPEKGASAIVELAKQIEKLQSLNNPSIGTTVNVCTIRGGTTTNVIPENAECTVDVRFSTMDEAARIDTAINGLEPSNKRVSLEILGGVNRPPMERTDAVIALYEKARALAASFGYELGETQVGGASDGNFVGALGVPVLDGLGISGDGAHTLNEYIYIDDIPKRAALMTMMLK
ncbi:MAG TPA: M20 family metallopeptidase [Pyrinomonadaceae bacterium]|nr:M20 family metallopeptidase [Pyrinomonadaceae bacterium]